MQRVVLQLLQNWFALSDPAMEKALYKSLHYASSPGNPPFLVLARSRGQATSVLSG
jgi:hypothetical protein